MSRSLFPARGARRVADEVYRVLLERIVEGELPPGARIEVDQIAQELDVSRTPVREAVLQLATTGMVERQPYRGTVVTGVDHARLEEVTALRIQLEGLAAELGAPRLTDAEIAQMSELQERIQSSVDDTDNSFRMFNELNRQFHGILYAAADAPSLVRIIDSLGVEADRMRLHFPVEHDLADAHHRAILDACRRRDAAEARDATRRHLLDAYLGMSGQSAAPATGPLAIVLREHESDAPSRDARAEGTTP